MGQWDRCRGRDLYRDGFYERERGPRSHSIRRHIDRRRPTRDLSRHGARSREMSRSHRRDWGSSPLMDRHADRFDFALHGDPSITDRAREQLSFKGVGQRSLPATAPTPAHARADRRAATTKAVRELGSSAGLRPSAASLDPLAAAVTKVSLPLELEGGRGTKLDVSTTPPAATGTKHKKRDNPPSTQMHGGRPEQKRRRTDGPTRARGTTACSGAALNAGADVLGTVNMSIPTFWPDYLPVDGLPIPKASVHHTSLPSQDQEFHGGIHHAGHPPTQVQASRSRQHAGMVTMNGDSMVMSFGGWSGLPTSHAPISVPATMEITESGSLMKVTVDFDVPIGHIRAAVVTKHKDARIDRDSPAPATASKAADGMETIGTHMPASIKAKGTSKGVGPFSTGMNAPANISTADEALKATGEGTPETAKANQRALGTGTPGKGMPTHAKANTVVEGMVPIDTSTPFPAAQYIAGEVGLDTGKSLHVPAKPMHPPVPAGVADARDVGLPKPAGATGHREGRGAPGECAPEDTDDGVVARGTEAIGAGAPEAKKSSDAVDREEAFGSGTPEPTKVNTLGGGAVALGNTVPGPAEASIVASSGEEPGNACKAEGIHQSPIHKGNGIAADVLPEAELPGLLERVGDAASQGHEGAGLGDTDKDDGDVKQIDSPGDVGPSATALVKDAWYLDGDIVEGPNTLQTLYKYRKDLERDPADEQDLQEFLGMPAWRGTADDRSKTTTLGKLLASHGW